MYYIRRFLLVLAAVSIISGCSSSGGPSPATITADNSKDLAVAATSAAKTAVNNDDTASYLPKTGTASFDVLEFSKQLRQRSFATEDISSAVCPLGGTAIAEGSETSGSITFTNCNVGSQLESVVLNGSMSFSSNSTGTSVSANFNLSITENGVTETISGSTSCTVDQTTGAENCSYNINTTGIDGRAYNVSDVSVSGSSFSGYTVSGSVNDPDHGTITINTTTPITFGGCSGGVPDGGEITFSSQGVAAMVTFNSDCTFTVTLDGVPTTYSWADI